MSKVNCVLLAVLGGMIASCTTISTLSLDQMVPADISFPPGIRKVAVVNNLPYPPVRWADNYSLADTENPIEGDGKVACESLSQSLADGNYFDRILICDSVLREKDTERKAAVLKPDEVRKLAEDLDADMVVSVDAVMIDAKPGAILSFDTEEIQSVVDATASVMVRLYIPSRKEPLTTQVYQDSLYWFSPVVDQDEIVERVSGFAGSLPVSHLIPQWVSVQRYFYSGGSSDLRDGAFALRHEDWEGALASWQKLLDSGGKKQKYAAFNIALYHEMQGDPEQAENWIGKAMELVPDSEKMPDYESQDYRLMKSYLTEIRKRGDALQKLNIQMNRFQEDTN